MSARRLWLIFVRSFLRILFILAFRVRVFGQKNIPGTGGVLIASNHQSYLDPMLLGIGVPRSVAYLARSSLFRFPVFGSLLRSVSAFPVTRGGSDLDAIRQAVAKLREGWPLLIFPEGTRTRDGEMGPLQAGALAVAVRAGVPIVPAYVDTFEAWPRGKSPRPHPVSVQYGRPIMPDEQARMSRTELIERLRNDLIALRAEARKRNAHLRGA